MMFFGIDIIWFLIIAVILVAFRCSFEVFRLLIMLAAIIFLFKFLGPIVIIILIILFIVS